MYNLEELLADKKKFFYVSKEVFKVVDTDDSGFISEDEMWIIMCSLADDFGYKRPILDEVKEVIEIVNFGNFYGKYSKLYMRQELSRKKRKEERKKNSTRMTMYNVLKLDL